MAAEMKLSGKKYFQTQRGWDAFVLELGKVKMSNYQYGTCVEFLDIRTPQQNKGIHLYCEWLAKALDEAQLSIHMEFLGKSIEVPYTKANVKENIWKPTMIAMTGKKSTTKLERKEVSEIYDVLNRFLIDKWDVYVPFPDRNEKG